MTGYHARAFPQYRFTLRYKTSTLHEQHQWKPIGGVTSQFVSHLDKAMLVETNPNASVHREPAQLLAPPPWGLVQVEVQC